MARSNTRGDMFRGCLLWCQDSYFRTRHMRIILTCRSPSTQARQACLPGHRVPFPRGPSRAPGSPDGPRQSRDGEWLDGEMVQSLKWPPISPTLATRGPHGQAGIWIRPSGNHPVFWRNNGFSCFCLDCSEVAMGSVCLFWFQVVTSR